MATNYQLVRVEKIYPSRVDALAKLSSLSFSFGTIVAIRYEVQGEDKHNCCCFEQDNSNLREILAAYISEDQGHYFVFADSNVVFGENGAGGLTIYQGTISNGQTPEEAIVATLFGVEPEERDIIILTNKEEGVNQTYIYLKGKWVCIGVEQAEIRFSDQFDWNESTRELKVKTIYGGSF